MVDLFEAVHGLLELATGVTPPDGPYRTRPDRYVDDAYEEVYKGFDVLRDHPAIPYEWTEAFVADLSRARCAERVDYDAWPPGIAAPWVGGDGQRVRGPCPQALEVLSRRRDEVADRLRGLRALRGPGPAATTPSGDPPGRAASPARRSRVRVQGSGLPLLVDGQECGPPINGAVLNRAIEVLGDDFPEWVTGPGLAQRCGGTGDPIRQVRRLVTKATDLGQYIECGPGGARVKV